MTVANLMNRPCSVVRRDASGVEDEYGNELPGETVVSTVCEFQQLSSEETAALGELASERARVWLPVDTDVEAGDALIVDDTEYEIEGVPSKVWNPTSRVFSHVEARVKHAGTSGDEPS